MRSHYCGDLRASHIGQTVTLCGWAHRRRDHGGVVFIDLRDRSGLVQLVADPGAPEVLATAERVRGEFVLRVEGAVRARPEGTANADLPTGAVEILCARIEILNAAAPLPFQIDSPGDLGEEVRLRFRYLDLRRHEMQERLQLRARIARILRRFLDAHGFLELETPMLTRATPEGARDYLVPSRTQPGSFFALPQSPQLFKQLFMIAGFDRYYQIVRCFRDEDLRADRQPEFTQLDIETSFMDEAGITNLMEAMIRELFREVLAVDLPDPLPRMTWAESMRRFGCDRPDLRIPMELVDVADLVRDCDFKVFAEPARDPAGRVAALRCPGGGTLSRKEIDDLGGFVAQYGAKGLAYIKVNEIARGRDGLQSPILKFLSDAAVAGIMQRTGAHDGDLVFFGADRAKVVNDALSALRLKLGHERGLAESGWRALWVTDFPMFEWDEDAERWVALHHPFTAPCIDDPAAVTAQPGTLISRAYDMVLNGSEIGGGSVRIHRPEMQQAVFHLLGMGDEEIREKFGFLVEALRYGAPPHGGIAFGLDRLVALMSGAASIREVIAFPKTQTASCPLTHAPAPVDETQLRDLGIRLRKPVEAERKG